uniref:Uncharacterized protein n=1 Tax=Anguilla anguilla TaxID=7936 RepID=A0A0E9XIV8_ANGAN
MRTREASMPVKPGHNENLYELIRDIAKALGVSKSTVTLLRSRNELVSNSK